MSTVEITKHIPETSPHIGSKFIGAYYLLTIVTGVFVLLFHGRVAFAVDLIVAVFYLVVTAFLYALSASARNSKR